MLAVHRPDAVRAAVTSGDLVALTKVPGIGRKGAERIVLELRDKIGLPTGPTTSADRPATAAWQGQVRDALVGLGWSARQADDAVESVAPAGRRGRHGVGPAQGRAPGAGPVSDGDAGGLGGVGRARRADGRRLVRGDDPGRRRAARRRRPAGRGRPAAAAAVGVPRPGTGPRPARARAGGGQAPRHAARPRPALRAPRTGQDHPGHDRGRRARAADPDHLRAGDPARRRPRRRSSPR